MTVLNITTKVEKTIADQWLAWAKKYCTESLQVFHHIKDCRLFTLMIEDNEPTYVLQLFFENNDDYRNYINNQADHFYVEQQLLFGAKYVSFETLMHQIV